MTSVKTLAGHVRESSGMDRTSSRPGRTMLNPLMKNSYKGVCLL